MSSSGGHREEDSTGFYHVNSAKSAIKALSYSRRFLTPSSPVLTRVENDRDDTRKSDRELFADEMALAMGGDDVEESMKFTLEIPPPRTTRTSRSDSCFP
jgi:hypothetical protein